MKKTITAIALATVVMFGATFANAGIIVGDRSENPCKVNTTGERNGIIVFGAKDGIIVFGVAGGIIVFGAREGIIVFGGKEETKPCGSSVEKSGIIVGD